MDGGDDTFYSLAFLDFAQGTRTDLDLHDRGGLVFKSAYGPDFRALNADEKEARRAAIEGEIAQRGSLYYSTFKDVVVPGRPLRPWGLLKNAQAGPPSDLWELYPYRWSPERLRAHYRDRALIALYPTLRGAEAGASGDGGAGVGWIAQAWDMAPDVLWLKPNAGYILGMIAYAASGSGRWKEAESALSLQSRIAPADIDAILNLGVVYEKTGRPAQAESAYKQALTIDPGASRPYFNLGALFWAQKRWADAASAFEAAASRSPGDASLASWARQARSKVR
jgi:tetratricopeptide (TPR) repeat protein